MGESSLHLMGGWDISIAVNLKPQGWFHKWLAQTLDRVKPIISCTSHARVARMSFHDFDQLLFT